ncbi:MAG: hypothetical protein HY791_03865 [Deltaproteobacteria bacterium]|nr:hypothetical protein [Deltaproteobacteria bacterium]
MIRIGRGIRRGLRRLRGLARKGMGLIGKASKLMSKLTQPLQKALGPIIDKLPLPDFAKSIAKNVLGNPLSLVGGGPLGLVGGVVGATGSTGSLLNVAQTFAGSAAGGNPQGLGNLAEIVAHQRAQIGV